MKFMLYKFQMDHNVAEETKNIYSAKDEGAVDQRQVIRWFKAFRLAWKDLKDQANSVRHKP